MLSKSTTTSWSVRQATKDFSIGFHSVKIKQSVAVPQIEPALESKAPSNRDGADIRSRGKKCGKKAISRPSGDASPLNSVVPRTEYSGLDTLLIEASGEKSKV